MHLAADLPMLHGLQLAATLGKTMPRQMSSIQGKQNYMAQQSFHLAFSCAAQHLLALQASLSTRPMPITADWLHTCSRNGTRRPMPTWAE